MKSILDTISEGKIDLAMVFVFLILAYLVNYLKKKATHIATKEDFEEILRQTEHLTTTSELIKAEIFRYDSMELQKWEFKRDSYHHLIEALSELGTFMEYAFHLMDSFFEVKDKELKKEVEMNLDNTEVDNKKYIKQLLKKQSSGEFADELLSDFYGNVKFSDLQNEFYSRISLVNKNKDIAELFISEGSSIKINHIMLIVEDIFNRTEFNSDEIQVEMKKGFDDAIKTIILEAKNDLKFQS